MINASAVDHIRKYGTCKNTGEAKRKILADEIGFPIGQKAEYVIITGCFQAQTMPHVLQALKNLLDHFQVSYTLLAKEYCCGWMTIGQPAVMSRNDEDINGFKELSREFIAGNFAQAEDLGARSIVLFCAACEPNYANCKSLTDLEVISYSELIDRFFLQGELHEDIDYYAGCYRFRRRITAEPLDLKAAERILKKINGLKVNYLDNKLCCYIKPHLEQLAASVKTRTVVNICTACHFNLKAKLGDFDGIASKMLPEIVWESVRK
jgi:Fe-S oxidoreductase